MADPSRVPEGVIRESADLEETRAVRANGQHLRKSDNRQSQQSAGLWTNNMLETVKFLTEARLTSAETIMRSVYQSSSDIVVNISLRILHQVTGNHIRLLFEYHNHPGTLGLYSPVGDDKYRTAGLISAKRNSVSLSEAIVEIKVCRRTSFCMLSPPILTIKEESGVNGAVVAAE